VEVDESKFGKRKFNQGHRVDGVWVLGGVERTQERKLFLVSVPDRSASTIVQLLARYVLPGSILYTDMWRGYSSVEAELSIQHLTVNHSQHFVDPLTGVHTNTIEGTWCGVKAMVPRRNRTEDAVDGHLFEYMWRRRNGKNLWAGFLRALDEVVWE
jgi:transposase-like protein